MERLTILPTRTILPFRQRPFPLNGTFVANVFCHFEPTGRHVDEHGNYYWKDNKPPEKLHGLAPYILPGSPEEDVWWHEWPDGWHYQDPRRDDIDNKGYVVDDKHTCTSADKLSEGN